VGPPEFVCARILAVAWCVLVLTFHDLGAGVLLRRPAPADHARAGEHEGIKQWPGTVTTMFYRFRRALSTVGTWDQANVCAERCV
jgi:hypothetical protein